MTIDVGQSIQTLTFYGEIPDNTGTLAVGYRVLFESRLSNKEVDMTTNVVSVTKNDYATDVLLTFDFTGSIDEDVEGYYEMKVQYNPTQELWSTWKSVLVKVKNGDADFEIPQRYVSDNEDNELITYYENE